MDELFAAAGECLLQTDPGYKVRWTRIVAAAWRQGEFATPDPERNPGVADDLLQPGRPAAPRLVPVQGLPGRKLGSERGRAALIHSLVHIEFNAINLALDAVYRFRHLPAAFYSDWMRIADEEASHFLLLRRHLRSLGHDYGDFDAHNGLWDMAMATREDVLLRMAVIPRMMEARGLDVTPGIMERLRAAGDTGAVAALEIILRDEIGHVAAGSRWFRHECLRRGLSPEKTFAEILNKFMTGKVRKPLYREARLQAGFSDEELRLLEEGTDFVA